MIEKFARKSWLTQGFESCTFWPAPSCLNWFHFTTVVLAMCLAPVWPLIGVLWHQVGTTWATWAINQHLRTETPTISFTKSFQKNSEASFFPIESRMDSKCEWDLSLKKLKHQRNVKCPSPFTFGAKKSGVFAVSRFSRQKVSFEPLPGSPTSRRWSGRRWTTSTPTTWGTTTRRSPRSLTLPEWRGTLSSPTTSSEMLNILFNRFIQVLRPIFNLWTFLVWTLFIRIFLKAPFATRMSLFLDQENLLFQGCLDPNGDGECPLGRVRVLLVVAEPNQP